jgi:outer membrane lipoprotein-sorting protein
MMVYSKSRFTVCGLAALSFAPAARADALADAEVVAMDKAMNSASTLVFDYQIFNQEPGKAERALAITERAKGSKLLLEFSAPADMAGTKVLILSPTQMYVYLPVFGKVRRIASHTKDTGFLGLAFSQDDLATTSYGPQYSAEIMSKTSTRELLVLKPKANVDTNYSKIEVTLDKARMLPLERRYFDAEGVNIKTETRSNYSCSGGVCTPAEIKMTNNVKGNWTRFVRKQWHQNVSISDDVFSERSLAP